jgi:hypothetical protein
VSEKEAWNSKPKERTCLGQVLGGSTLGHTEIIRKPTEQYRTIHMFVRGLLWECFCRIVRWRCHGPNGYYHSIRYSIYAIWYIDILLLSVHVFQHISKYLNILANNGSPLFQTHVAPSVACKVLPTDLARERPRHPTSGIAQ